MSQVRHQNTHRFAGNRFAGNRPWRPRTARDGTIVTISSGNTVDPTRSLPGGQDEAVETTRVDRWLWAVRIFKTRTSATDACRDGQVRVNDLPAKAATTVRRGDRIRAEVHGRTRIVEVVEVVEKRVGPPVAATCLIDHSPPASDEDPGPFARDRGAGRPTKRDRRQLDRLRSS